MAESSEGAPRGRSRVPTEGAGRPRHAMAAALASVRHLPTLRHRREVQVAIPPWIGPPVPVPAMCAACGAEPARGAATAPGLGERFEPSPVVVHERVRGTSGGYTAHAELLFPVCRAPGPRSHGDHHDIDGAVRVVGARRRAGGVEIVLAFRNRAFARAFAARLAEHAGAAGSPPHLRPAAQG